MFPTMTPDAMLRGADPDAALAIRRGISPRDPARRLLGARYALLVRTGSRHLARYELTFAELAIVLAIPSGSAAIGPAETLAPAAAAAGLVA